MEFWKVVQLSVCIVFMLLDQGIEGQMQLRLVPPNAECGYVEQDPVCNEVIGGNVAVPTRFPYIVSLQIVKDSTNKCFFHFCGATLIAPDVVLTAAHCIQNVAPTNKREGSMAITVYASLAPFCRHGPSSIVGSPDRVKVAYYILHPEYARYTLENDIAVLKLEEPLTGPEGPFVRYKIGNGGLLEGAALNTLYQSLQVVGYGDTNPDESKLKQYNLRQLRRANLQYLSDTPCQHAFNSTFTPRKLVPEKMMCAWNYTADACSGDAGGPLIVTGIGQTSGAEQDYTMDLQVGIVSWGPSSSCNSTDYQHVGVYTQVEYYIGWLDAAIVQLNNNVKSATFVENEMFFSNTENLCLTARRCRCKSFQQYQGKSFSGCNNPDDDPTGSWCIVDVKTCMDQPSGTISVTGEFWDFCNCIQTDFVQEIPEDESTVDCPTTVYGCKCKPGWEHSGVWYQGCDNPDGDPTGKWCHIQGDFDSCSNYNNSNDIDFTFKTSRTVLDNSGNLLSYYDYCREEVC